MRGTLLGAEDAATGTPYTSPGATLRSTSFAAAADRSIAAAQIKLDGAITNTLFRLISRHSFSLQPPEPRFLSIWRDDGVTSVTDTENYTIMGVHNAYYATTGITRVRLRATLYPAYPGTSLTPGDLTPYPHLGELHAVPWSLFACDLGDPVVLYPGLATAPSPSYAISVSPIDFGAPRGSSLIASGVVPAGGVGQAIDVSWRVANPEAIQFYLRDTSAEGFYPETLNTAHPEFHARYAIPGSGKEFVSTLTDFQGSFVPAGGGNYNLAPTLRIDLYGPSVAGAPPEPGQIITGEPGGTASGSDTTFGVAYPYVPGSLLVRLNGINVTDALVAADPAAGTFTFATTPGAGSELTYDYVAA